MTMMVTLKAARKHTRLIKAKVKIVLTVAEILIREGTERKNV